VPRTFLYFLLSAFSIGLGVAEDSTFQRIRVPDAKGRPINAVLTFTDKTLEVRPVKGNPVTIPYAQIDKFSYEYTKKHRINEGTITTAPLGIGAVAMLTKSRRHWLEIHYTDQNLPKTYVIRMDKHNYLRILDAVKAHTGKDAEVLGNADKRR
jgi:hypothetical protein